MHWILWGIWYSTCINNPPATPTQYTLIQWSYYNSAYFCYVIIKGMTGLNSIINTTGKWFLYNGTVWITIYIIIFQEEIFASLGPESNDPLQWRHNERDGVSNHLPNDCLLSRLFRHRSKKTSKLRTTDLCEGNSPVRSVNSSHKGPVTRKMFPFDDVIIRILKIPSQNPALTMASMKFGRHDGYRWVKIALASEQPMVL